MTRCRFCDAVISADRERCPSCGAEVPAEDRPHSEAPPSALDLVTEIRDALARAGKIEAIRLYRERTGAGLAEAKNAVEAITAGRLAARPELGSPGYPYFELELVELLRKGRKIAAIKAYRERTGLGLKESKDAVEAIAEKHGIPKGTGCVGPVAVLIGAILALAVAYFGLR